MTWTAFYLPNAEAELVFAGHAVGAGALLAYYLCSVEALSLMPPLTLLVFQLLWLLPVALMTEWTGRY